MKKLITVIALFGLALWGCSPIELGDDPRLIGKWADSYLQYQFNTDKSFDIKYLRNTAGKNITTDYAFGTYYVDTKRNNITFEIKGYSSTASKDTNQVFYNGTTWNYTLADSTLKYESKTTIGLLFKVK